MSHSLRDQLRRNLDAMARELSRDPGADQAEWTRQLEQLAMRCDDTATSGDFGSMANHTHNSVESLGTTNCYDIGVVVAGPKPGRNLVN